MKYKDNILRLRKEGKTYNEIVQLLGCTKGVISFHCSKLKENKKIIKDNSKGFFSDYVFPSDKLDIFKWLMKENVSRTRISEILLIPYQEIINYGVRNNLRRNSNKEPGYKTIKEYRRQTKILAVAYKGRYCKHCNCNVDMNKFHFHHIDRETKLFTISNNLNLAWPKIKKELDKCILLCSECHIDIHRKK